MIIHGNLSNSLQLSITKSCEVLEVSRSGYYNWIKQSESASKKDETDLRDEIQEIVLEFPGYGYRRVTAELRNRGHVVNSKRVLRLMRSVAAKAPERD